MYLSIYLSSVSRSPLFRGSSKTSTENAGQNETLMKQINEKMFRNNLLRIHPEWSPGGPLEGPWKVPGTSPGPLEGSPDPFWRSRKDHLKKRNVQGIQKSQFWDPAGTQKSTKNRSLAQKIVPRIDFSSILPANIVFLTFGLDLSLIFN